MFAARWVAAAEVVAMGKGEGMKDVCHKWVEKRTWVIGSVEDRTVTVTICTFVSNQNNHMKKTALSIVRALP